ncbi:MAG: DUF4355 domain-containing protein [bacterium]
MEEEVLINNENQDVKEEVVNNEVEEAKTYTEKDLTDALQLEKTRLIKELEEQKELEALPIKERAEAEQKLANARIQELEKKLLKRDLKELAYSTLTAEGLPAELSKLLNYDSKENMLSSLDNTKATFEKCLAKAVQDKLKGKTPQGLNNNSSIKVTENSLKESIASNIRGGF